MGLMDMEDVKDHIAYNWIILPWLRNWAEDHLWKFLLLIPTAYLLKALPGKVGLYLKSLELDRKREEYRELCRIEIEQMRRDVHASGISEAEVESITGLPLVKLATVLRQGHVKPSKALLAYQAKALQAHDFTNCLVRPLKEAMAIAKSLDSRKPEGMLYGIPISVKDTNNSKGYPSVMGVAGFVDFIADEDCLQLELLRKQGAVPFVRTNTPQLAMSHECSNPIFGITTNPHDPSRTAGGSSGGEAALIASGGSPLGIGNDLGGSLRCPAAYSGCCTLKPSSLRLSSIGTLNSFETGQQIVMESNGPMSAQVDGLVLYMKSVLQPESWRRDHRVAPIPFRDEIFSDKRRMKIGYFVEQGDFPAVPACQRAVLEAKAALERQGHEVIPWAMPGQINEFLNLELRALGGDGGDLLGFYTAGESKDYCIRAIFSLLHKPGVISWFRSLWYKLTDSRYAELYQLGRAMDAGEWWALSRKVEELRTSFCAAWRKEGLDAIICPTVAAPAPRFSPGDASTALFMLYAAGYLMTFNVLDFPAGVVPVSKVTREDVRAMKYYKLNHNAWVVRRMQQEMETAEGMPVSVQVVTLKWEEELCLRVMKEVEAGLG